MSLIQYKKNRNKYIHGGVDKYLFLFDKSVMKINDSRNEYNATLEAYIESQRYAPQEVWKVNDVVFSQSTSYDNKYKYENTLTITIDCDVNLMDSLIGNEKKYSIMIKSLSSNSDEYYAFNYDFEYSVTSETTFEDNAENNYTTLTLTSFSNIPLLIVDFDFKGYLKFAIQHHVVKGNTTCAYNNGAINHLYIFSNYNLHWRGGHFEDFITDMCKEIEFNKNSLTANETFDGQKYTHSITFDLGFDFSSNVWSYLFEEKMRYKVILETNKGYYVFGNENPMRPQHQINTNDEENTITFTLSTVQNNKMMHIQ